MGDNFFEPNELWVVAGQSIRLNLSNDGEFVHNLRIAGGDGVYNTDDDLVSTQSTIKPGETGELVGRINEPSSYNFRDDFHPAEMTGTITVR